MGMSLAFRDAHTLAAALLMHDDWDEALEVYAGEHDEYFGTIVTGENWQSELQLSSGPEAERRRKHALDLWRQDPSRAIDLPGLGPNIDVSEAARVRFFGEDVPVAEATPVRLPVVIKHTPGEAFLAAIRERDFQALAGRISETARMRGLLPSGPVEFHGREEIAQTFGRWFGNLLDFGIEVTEHDEVADRLKLTYRFTVRMPDDDALLMVEQTVYAKVIDGQLAVVDLLCTGFRPIAVAIERIEAAA
jgi:hypothetical protein